MAKQSGLGHRFLWAGYNLSGDITAASRLAGGMTPIEGCTGIDKSAHERLGGKRTAGMTVTSWWNPSAGAAHDVFSTLPTTAQHGMYVCGSASAAAAFMVRGVLTDYPGTRAEDGSYSHESVIESDQYGGEWGTLLTAVPRTDTGATNGTGVDFTTAGDDGLQAYLQVLSFTGTDVTIKLQQSSDNGAGDAFADVTGGAFASVTSGPQTQRIATADNQAIERYLRVATATSGGFTSVSFVVAVVYNRLTPVF